MWLFCVSARVVVCFLCVHGLGVSSRVVPCVFVPLVCSCVLFCVLDCVLERSCLLGVSFLLMCTCVLAVLRLFVCNGFLACVLACCVIFFLSSVHVTVFLSGPMFFGVFLLFYLLLSCFFVCACLCECVLFCACDLACSLNCWCVCC